MYIDRLNLGLRGFGAAKSSGRMLRSQWPHALYTEWTKNVRTVRKKSHLTSLDFFFAPASTSLLSQWRICLCLWHTRYTGVRAGLSAYLCKYVFAIGAITDTVDATHRHFVNGYHVIPWRQHVQSTCSSHLIWLSPMDGESQMLLRFPQKLDTACIPYVDIIRRMLLPRRL